VTAQPWRRLNVEQVKLLSCNFRRRPLYSLLIKMSRKQTSEIRENSQFWVKTGKKDLKSSFL
jgi:hypothetical protein